MGLSQDHFLVGLALLLSVLFFGYMIASSSYIYMFRPFHYGNLVQRHSDPDKWDDKFKKSWDFEDGWGQNRRILFWTMFIGFLAGIGFLVTSIIIWNMNKYKLEKHFNFKNTDYNTR